MLKLKNEAVFFFLISVLIYSCKKELLTQQPQNNLVDNVKDTIKIVPINNTITFSGQKWQIKNSPNKREAPGNNFWSDNSVWVDGKGYLHLMLRKDPESNKWFCAEISSENKFGNGSYEFWIQGRIDLLDKNVVFGLFNYAGKDYYDEIDIEFSRWGNTQNKNLHYSVYPEEGSSAKIWNSSVEFSLNEPYSIHRLTKSNTSVKFESYYDIQRKNFYTQTYNSSTISKKEMPVYINLWAFQNTPPSDQKEIEIIIQKFIYTK